MGSSYVKNASAKSEQRGIPREQSDPLSIPRGRFDATSNLRGLSSGSSNTSTRSTRSQFLKSTANSTLDEGPPVLVPEQPAQKQEELVGLVPATCFGGPHLHIEPVTVNAPNRLTFSVNQSASCSSSRPGDTRPAANAMRTRLEKTMNARTSMVTMPKRLNCRRMNVC